MELPSFRLHNFCGLIQTLAFSFLTRAIVQFLLLSSTLGSVKGITQREVNYSIPCVMRRSFLFEQHGSFDFCILHMTLTSNWQVVESIKQGHQALVFVHTRKDTGKTARTLVSTIPSLLEASHNCLIVVELQYWFPLVHCLCVYQDSYATWTGL